MIWVRNSLGRKDVMLTFALVSFSIVTLNILLSSFGSITFGTTVIQFQALDSAIMAVYLGATFTAYVSRRWTDQKYGPAPEVTDNRNTNKDKKDEDNEDNEETEEFGDL